MSLYGIIYLLASFASQGDFSNLIYQFEKNSDLINWYIVDDVVMGGRSDGHLMITKDGTGLFYGKVSLENYGGFSSIRYQVPAEANDIATAKTIKLRVKGDGKNYQFRLKKNSNDRHSYISTFQTSGKWEVVELKLSDLYPSFRGMKLDMDNYDGNTITELSILISNKKNESFQIEVDWIARK